MGHFQYHNGVLHAESVSLDAIAASAGAPVFVYSAAALRAQYRAYAKAFAGAGLNAQVCYAVKANGNLAVLSVLAAEGAGADVVSGGELLRAMRAGIPPSRIVFSGVGKRDDELTAALAAGVMQINVESAPELERLGALAADRGVKAPVAVRVNPDVDAGTHEKISTGRAQDKFGVGIAAAAEVCARAREMAGIDLAGVAVHIGSQLTDLAPYRAAYAKVRDFVQSLRAAGADIRRVDLGGGLGVAYGDDPARDAAIPGPDAYARMAAEIFGGLGCELALEPGRFIAANAGVLLSRVIYVKQGAEREIAVLDAGMNDLIRPALYGAYHQILPVREAPPGAAARPYDVVGPICETGDAFARARALAPLQGGDLVAFMGAGAYGAVMASAYNARALAPEVLTDGAQFAVVRDRIDVERQLEWESVPGWLKAPVRAPVRAADKAPGGGAAK
ncbi:MAG: diaminopimelate decarboxylase [Rhodospirillales bacterium]